MFLPGELRVISRLQAELDPLLCVDVGSSFGDYTKLLAEACPNSLVMAFDFQNGTPAIGAVNGTLEVDAFPHCPERSTGAPHYRAQLQSPYKVTRTVPLRRLDSLVPWEPDFVKIDVEGMSYDVLLGLGALRPTLVQFEWGWGEEMEGRSLTDFYLFFKDWNYSIRELDWACPGLVRDTYYNFLAGPPRLVERFF